jgi:hypothetical protein
MLCTNAVTLPDSSFASLLLLCFQQPELIQLYAFLLRMHADPGNEETLHAGSGSTMTATNTMVDDPWVEH